jgi:hypothetical protein
MTRIKVSGEVTLNRAKIQRILEDNQVALEAAVKAALAETRRFVSLSPSSEERKEFLSLIRGIVEDQPNKR